MSRDRARMPCARPVAFLAMAASLLAVTGCGDGRLATYPVTGVVMVDGKPAPDALVIFCPVAGRGPEELMRLRPAAETDADGRYQLTTFETHDGAPAGDYQVIVRWGPRPETTGEARPERIKRPPDRLRGRYMNPQTSGLTATVDEESNEVPPFELSMR